MTLEGLTRPVVDYASAEAFVLALVRDDPRPYRERASTAGRAVLALLRQLGDPHLALRFAHLAGSKGKGSVALMLEALMLDAQLRVGCFTSPHLRRWNERFRIEGAPIGDAAMVGALERVRREAHALIAKRDPAIAPTFFDVLTAAGLLMFAESSCELVVLEAGLGGRFDATNVIRPEVACITSIELEHTDKLGTRLADVAWHKAGIVKPGVPLVSGSLPDEASEVVAACVRTAAAPWRRLGVDFDVRAEPAGVFQQWVRYRSDGVPRRFQIAHPSRHMAVNAALAIECATAIGIDASANVLSNVQLPARAQLLNERPWILVDCAHTARSLHDLGQLLARIPASRRRFVVSSTHGKALGALCDLVTGSERVYATCADPIRSQRSDALADALGERLPGLAITACTEPTDALNDAVAALPPDTLLCVCGSVYLAGLALETLAPSGARDGSSAPG